MNYGDYNGSHSINGLGSFNTASNDDKKLYSRHSLGTVFGYGDSSMDACLCVWIWSFVDNGRNDLLLPNLPDVMENDGLSSSVNPPMNSLSVNRMGNGMGSGMGSGMGNPMSNSMNKPMGTAMNTSMNKPMNTSMNKPMSTAMNTSMESTMGSGGNLF